MKTTNQTKGIGFKNFRRFENFPMLEFGKITYMVGRNNSGKSTMVKALLLVMDYLQNQLSDTFSFDNKVLEDANIVTFGRAKCNLSDDPEIMFELKLDNYNITINISGKDESTTVNVISLSIYDNYIGYYLDINFNKNSISLKSKESTETRVDRIKINTEKNKILNEIKTLEYELQEKGDNLNKITSFSLNTKDKINKLRDKLNKFIYVKNVVQGEEEYIFNKSYPIDYKRLISIDSTIERAENIPDEYFETPVEERIHNEDDMYEIIPQTENNPLKEIISLFLYHNTITYKREIDARTKTFDESPEAFGEITEIENNKNRIKSWIDNFVNVMNNESYFYLGANPSKQSALFPLRAKDNALSQAIHQFKQSGILEGEPEWEFVKKWMRKFEVGEDFEIKFHAGEAYEFHVFNTNLETNNFTKTWNHLADKGMGSLQAMLLILRVATLIHKNKKEKQKITLLVEEPELNLHPALQSLLTEFFHEVNLKYGFNFIVETHSEYVIRKAQLMALEEDYISNQELNPNPFKIVYFHKEEGPYEMKFTEQGRFERDFGPGFYDTAAKISMEIIKQGRKKTAL